MGGGETLNRVGHLENYCVELRTFGPVFIGAGFQYSKNGYLFDPRERTISIIREDALLKWIIESGNVDAYERYVLTESSMGLNRMLERMSISPKEKQKLIRYTIDVGSVLREGISLKQIDAFIRNANGEAYIPGSSLKGALRTSLLFSEIQTKGRFPETKRGTIPEDAYFHVLNLKAKKQDAVNSIMRGISIADSARIPDHALTLAQKVDLRQDGQKREPNLVRECIKPGQKICFSMTLDRSILGTALRIDEMMRAISDFFQYYRDTFSMRFSESDPDAPQSGSYIFLGGGGGFFGKTVVYPYLGYDAALGEVSERLNRSFRRHHHDQDTDRFDISPHCMKYGATDIQLSEFGLCEVKVY